MIPHIASPKRRDLASSGHAGAISFAPGGESREGVSGALPPSTKRAPVSHNRYPSLSGRSRIHTGVAPPFSFCSWRGFAERCWDYHRAFAFAASRAMDSRHKSKVGNGGKTPCRIESDSSRSPLSSALQPATAAVIWSAPSSARRLDVPPARCFKTASASKAPLSALRQARWLTISDQRPERAILTGIQAGPGLTGSGLFFARRSARPDEEGACSRKS